EVAGAGAADGENLEGQHGEVLGRRRAGQVEYRVHGAVDVERLAHVVIEKPEAFVVSEMGHVGARPGDEGVDRDDLVAAVDKSIAEMGADEAGPARDDDSAHARPMLV